MDPTLIEISVDGENQLAWMWRAQGPVSILYSLMSATGDVAFFFNEALNICFIHSRDMDLTS